ncbi:MAG: FAD binding domain-containing protein [Bacteriovoracaceae bacterium]|jgi:xanthine dehydrogenase small subunit|nr:FAD binding domain-containing protein [Bacteriovoracaceae bacterium]
MKNEINLQINGKSYTVKSANSLLPLADFLRYEKGLTGTKVVCAEGDCGACTLLVADAGSDDFKSVNSCIGFVYQYDGKNIVTVEGLKDDETLHPVQDAMAKHHGAQCGYCTPGIVCSLAQLCDQKVKGKKELNEKSVKNALTGNLCRCTGYGPIIEAGKNIDTKNAIELSKRYPLEKNDKFNESILIEDSGVKLFVPTNLKELLEFKDKNTDAKFIIGGTDLGVLSNKFKWKMQTVISLSKMNFKKINISDDAIEIGASVTLHEVERALENDYPEFSRLLHVFASPQIKNSGTLVGNLANGSPIGDTIPFLKVVHAKLELESVNGKRQIDINDFYLDYKKMDIKDNEIITKVIIPKSSDVLKLYKVSARKDLDISAVTFAGKVSIKENKIDNIALAFGGVGPIVLRMDELESDLKGSEFSKENFQKAATKVIGLVSPFTDVRGSDEFRKRLCHNLMMKFYNEVSDECR